MGGGGVPFAPFFSMWGPFLGLPPYENFCGRPWVRLRFVLRDCDSKMF